MMAAVFDVMGAIGASLLLLALGLAMFAAAFVSGHWVSDRRKSPLLGILAGLAVFALVTLLFARSLEALTETSCVTAKDRQACIEGDDG